MIVWWRLAYVWWKCPKDKNKWMCRSHESQSRDVVMIKFKTFLCSYESQSRDVRRIETNETYLMCSHESQSTVQCDRIETIYLCYHEWQSRDSKNWPTIWESKKIQSHFPQPIWFNCFNLFLPLQSDLTLRSFEKVTFSSLQGSQNIDPKQSRFAEPGWQ